MRILFKEKSLVNYTANLSIKTIKTLLHLFGIYLTNQLMVQNQALFWVITELGVMVP